MWQLLDILLTFAHLALIGFNLLGWLWPKTRKWHLVTIILTAASWLILGIWYGWGYCPITDWQWQVKRHLGQTNLPASFITWFAETLTSTNLNNALIDRLTAYTFALVAALSVYFNFFGKKSPQKRDN